MSTLLPRAVKSVSRQDYDNIELLIVDDGSNEAVDYDRFSVDGVEYTWLGIAHGGKSRAVNRGLERASGEYVAVLDADDRLPEKSLSTRMEALQQSEADLVIGSFEIHYRGGTGGIRGIEKFRGQSKRRVVQALLTNVISPFHQNAMLFHRHLLERTGGMDPRMLRGQDKDFAVRLLHQSRKMVLVEEPVYIYNKYERPLSVRIRNRCMGMKYKLQVIGRYFKGWRRVIFLSWGLFVEAAKLVYDFFGVYKR